MMSSHTATTLVTADPVESVTWRLHDQLVRFLCRVVFMQDAFDFFVYSGVLDFGHGHLSGYDDRGGGWIYPP